MVPELARAEGIDPVTDPHWTVMGVTVKELDQLFPKGPAKIAARIAGIPKFFTFFGLDAIHKKRQEHIKIATVGNPGLHVATWLGGFPGMSSVLREGRGRPHHLHVNPTRDRVIRPCRRRSRVPTLEAWTS